MTRTTFKRSSVPVVPISVLLLGLLGILWPASAPAQETDDDFISNEVVVKLVLDSKGTTDCSNTINNIRRSDETVKEELVEDPKVACIYLLQLPSSNADVRADSIEETYPNRVAYAEPNFVVDAPEGDRFKFHGRPDGAPEPKLPEEPYRSQDAVRALNLPNAHEVSRGDRTTVAVLDTGVQSDHPELAGSLVPGYDFVGTPSGPGYDRTPEDEPGGIMAGHGTHVSGIVHLTAPEAKIMPLRVLDPDGRGNAFEIAEAAQFAIDPDRDPSTDDSVDVINMSLGSVRESELLSDVIEALEVDDDDEGEGRDDDDEDVLKGVPSNGVVIVASAGNESTSEKRYPAAGDAGGGEGVLSVTSVDAQARKSGFANFDDRTYATEGSWIDIAAPGDDIYSLFPEDQYAEWDGTSMAAPFVAGQAALIRSVQCDLPATADVGSSVERQIESSSRSLDAQNPDFESKLGAGHADTAASLDVPRPKIDCNTAPTISQPRPFSGSETRDRTPLISAKASDAQTNLAKSDVRLYLDGRNTSTFSYNAETNRLARKAGKLSYGYHKVKITATDELGRSTVRSWGFRVRR